jgi:type IV secretion system protein VirD4
VYGEDGSRTLLKTLAGRIYFQPKDMEDAEEISRELGFTTVRVKTHSKPVWELSNGKTGRHRSVSVSEQRRPLMLPQEVRSLGKDREIVFTEDTPPILCRKIRYYRIAALRNRIRKPPLVPAIELRRDGPLPDRERAAQPVDRGDSTDASVPDHQSGMQRAASARDRADTAPRAEASVESVNPTDGLMLEDFEADFSQVKIPDHDGPLTREEMQTAVASFLDTLEIGVPHGR